MKKVLLLNGPNLALLGTREPEIYGRTTLADIVETVKAAAKDKGVEVDAFQSDVEGELVAAIGRARGAYDAIIINPAAYTHTSVAILDALKAVNLPAAEVHLTDITKREPFRQISYAGMACQAHFMGLGFAGYGKALEWMKEQTGKPD